MQFASEPVAFDFNGDDRSMLISGDHDAGVQLTLRMVIEWFDPGRSVAMDPFWDGGANPESGGQTTPARTRVRHLIPSRVTY